MNNLIFYLFLGLSFANLSLSEGRDGKRCKFYFIGKLYKEYECNFSILHKIKSKLFCSIYFQCYKVRLCYAVWWKIVLNNSFSQWVWSSVAIIHLQPIFTKYEKPIFWFQMGLILYFILLVIFRLVFNFQNKLIIWEDDQANTNNLKVNTHN